MQNEHALFMQKAIDLARQGMNANEGGPFGCIVVKDGRVLAEGNNVVFSTNDPTAHAEIVAIRKACEALKSFQLDDCYIYSSCEPCPMCLGAIYWARPKGVYFACTREDAAGIEFDDALIYAEIAKPMVDRKIPFKQLLRDQGLKVFRDWENKEDKIKY